MLVGEINNSIVCDNWSNSFNTRILVAFVLSYLVQKSNGGVEVFSGIFRVFSVAALLVLEVHKF